MKKGIITGTICCFILGIICLPVLIGTKYGLPTTDDFSSIYLYMVYPKDNHIWYYWENVIGTYLGWQGNYFGVLLAAIPTYHLFGLTGVRIEMLISALLFIASYALLIVGITEILKIDEKKKNSIRLVLLSAGLFYSLCADCLDEVLYWNVAVCVYTIPLSMSLLTLFCYIRYEINPNKIRWVVIGTILALCGSGGALDVSAMLCGMLLFGILYNFIVLRKISKSWVIGLGAFVGSVINTVAPGNYKRHYDTIDSEIRLVDSFINTAKRIVHLFTGEFQTVYLIIITIIVFVFAFNSLKNSDFRFRFPGLVTIYGLFVLYITDFPVVLGYSSEMISQRNVFIEHVTVSLIVIFVVVYWAGWFACRNNSEVIIGWKIPTGICAALLIALLICKGSAAVTEITPVKMIIHMMNGDFNAVSQIEEGILEEIKNSPDKDVVINIDSPGDEVWSNICPIGLGADKDYYVNMICAYMFNKDSVVVYYN